MQEFIVALIVLAAALHLAWTLSPRALRFRAAAMVGRRASKSTILRALHRRMLNTAFSCASGCGSGCGDRGQS